jgi:hypothetical protein
MAQALPLETKTKLRNSMLVLAIAIIVAVVFNCLFFNKAVGISLFIFTAFVFGICLWLSLKFKVYTNTVLWLALPALFFSLMAVFRANEVLIFLDVLAIIGLVLLTTRILTNDKLINFGLMDYVLTVVLWPFKFLRSFFLNLSFISRTSQGTSSGHWKRVLIGFLITLPVLFFFGALFMSADLAFKTFVDNAISFNIPEHIIQQAFLISAVFVAALGVMAFTFGIPEKYIAMYAPYLKPAKQAAEKIRNDYKVEVAVSLSLIALLFALFIVFQISYLFGGEANIVNSGFTYAEYARRGFGELVVVAFASLIILLTVDSLTKKSLDRAKWFILPSLIIVAEIIVIIISAFKRLMLYQSAYGITDLRLYVSGFIILLGIIFMIFTAKLLLKKPHSFFALGVLISMIGFIAVFNLLNPDKFIAEQNIARFEKTQKLDVEYISKLSADAVPTVLQVYKKLNNEEKIVMSDFMTAKAVRLMEENSPWQSYNISRRDALESLLSEY